MRTIIVALLTSLIGAMASADKGVLHCKDTSKEPKRWYEVYIGTGKGFVYDGTGRRAGVSQFSSRHIDDNGDPAHVINFVDPQVFGLRVQLIVSEVGKETRAVVYRGGIDGYIKVAELNSCTYLEPELSSN